MCSRDRPKNACPNYVNVCYFVLSAGRGKEVGGGGGGGDLAALHMIGVSGPL